MNSASSSYLLFFFSLTALGVPDEPKPPETQVTVPGQLVTAEAFDRAESLSPKGTAGWRDPKGRIGMVAKGEGAQFRNVAVWKAQPKR